MLSAKQKIFYSLLVSFTVLVAIVGFIVWPALSQVKSYAANIIFQKATLKLLQDQITTLENFQKNYDLYVQQFQRLAHGFVDSEVPIDFIKYLEDMAKKDHLEIIIAPLGFDYGGKKKDALPISDFQVNISGALSNCFRFLERLENGPWFLEIRQANLEVTEVSASKNGPSDTMASLSLNFSAFSYITPSPAVVK